MFSLLVAVIVRPRESERQTEAFHNEGNGRRERFRHVVVGGGGGSGGGTCILRHDKLQRPRTEDRRWTKCPLAAPLVTWRNADSSRKEEFNELLTVTLATLEGFPQRGPA